MKVSELFDVDYGNSLALNQLEQVDEDAGIPFVSRTAQNNGVVAWVRPLPDVEPFPAGRVTVCLRSRNHALASFVQMRPFYTAYHLFVLTPKRSMNVRERLWWAMCIEHNRYRYNFGRQANRSLANIDLPDSIPEWVKEVAAPSISTAAIVEESVELPPAESWAPFWLEDLFIVHRGRSVVRRDAVRGSTPLVTASSRNNGVSAFIAAPPDHPAGRITVCSNGSVGEAFVQSLPFVATADVSILEPRLRMSPEAQHFVCALIRREKYRFNYGRKWPAAKIASSKIRLPVSKDDSPDIVLMERYMRSLPLSAAALTD